MTFNNASYNNYAEYRLPKACKFKKKGIKKAQSTEAKADDEVLAMSCFHMLKWNVTITNAGVKIKKLIRVKCKYFLHNFASDFVFINTCIMYKKKHN